MLRNPLPVVNDQHAIALPLETVVTALPAELLTHQGQTTLDINTPEFNKLPKLFEDEGLEEPVRAEQPVATIEPKTAAPTAIATIPEEPPTPVPPPPSVAPTAAPAPVSSVASPASPPAEASRPPMPQAASDNQILVSLRSLIAVMPDHVFACPRAELWRRVDLDVRVPLPRDIVLPQLQMARVRIPLAVAVAAMPPAILASPLPPITNETVPLALPDIVSQLPPQLFASAGTQSDEETLDFSESEIPTPFKEKSFAAVEPELITAALAEAGVVEPSQPSPEAGPNVFEIPADTLADESLSIFGEKTPAQEPVAAQPEPQPEPAPQPVAEIPAPAVEAQPEQTPQPIAEIEPVAEAIANAEIAAPAPVEAPPAIAAQQTIAEPPAPPAPVAEAPVAPEIVHEVVTPAEPTPPAPSLPPTENKFLVNLNNSSAEDLAKIDGVDPILAQRIIELRNAQGGFKSLKELRHVAGINRKALRTLIGPPPRALNRLLNIEHDEELTLQEVVRLTSQIKGVAGCMLTTSDGVLLTGQVPAHLDQEAVSVFTPQLFKEVGRYMKEVRVGQITRLSVFTDQQPLSIFGAGDIFLVVIHDPSHFSKALLRRCERISQEIARLCPQRAVV
jgi:predicted regulator of Ras-like GTPase activity (Roadblock/LC7/MglB family)